MVGDKVFVTGEIDWLFCFDAKLGKELWKLQLSLLDSSTLGAVQSEAEAMVPMAKFKEQQKGYTKLG